MGMVLTAASLVYNTPHRILISNDIFTIQLQVANPLYLQVETGEASECMLWQTADD